MVLHLANLPDEILAHGRWIATHQAERAILPTSTAPDYLIRPLDAMIPQGKETAPAHGGALRPLVSELRMAG